MYTATDYSTVTTSHLRNQNVSRKHVDTLCSRVIIVRFFFSVASCVPKISERINDKDIKIFTTPLPMFSPLAMAPDYRLVQNSGRSVQKRETHAPAASRGHHL